MSKTPQTTFSDRDRPRPAARSTTVLLVRHGGKTVMASDGQVTLQDSIVKTKASKVKRVGRGDIIVGFAGGAADGLALFTRFEAKLDEFQGNLERAVIELAKDWRTDRVLRQLQAMMIIADDRQSFLMSGTGDLLQPDDEGPLAIGSGANYALAAARALLRHTELDTRQVVEEAMKVAAEICIYTNDQLTIEEL
ncbi:MAG: ATP-dependent protease subunit HslV [Thermoanaerobaculia bacterium]